MQEDRRIQHSCALPRVSIGQRLQRGAVVVCVLFLTLAAALLWYQTSAYQGARRATRAFDTLRLALSGIEKVSVERGPSNAAMGEALPLTADVVQRLQRARRDTDAAFARLAAQLSAEHCPRCATDLKVLEQAQADLTQARANIDGIVRLPRPQRSAPMLDDAINRMVAIVPELIPIATTRNLSVVKGDSDTLDPLQMAFLAAMLREQAGLLGSRFTGALGTRRTLDEAEQRAIERSEGRVEQLYRLMAWHILPRSDRVTRYLEQVQRQYVTEGLGYVANVRRQASVDGSGTPTTKEFAEQYVPLMHSIVEFRDVALDSAQRELHRRLVQLRLQLMLTAMTGLTSASLLALVLWLFGRYVMRPFNEATQAAMAIAHGTLDGQRPRRRYPDDIQKLFDALEVLRENSRARLQLEQEHRRLISDLTSMAETDSLTGLLNRRAFEKTLLRLAGPKPDAAPDTWVSMILFDIDHFKRINDTHGHAAGDMALLNIADLCRDIWAQHSSGMARLGGEEFAALFETQDPAQVIRSAERFREKLASVVLRAATGNTFTMTASFGIAFMKHSQRPNLDTLLHHADGLLYQAKANGRNRIETQTIDADTQES